MGWGKVRGNSKKAGNPHFLINSLISKTRSACFSPKQLHKNHTVEDKPDPDYLTLLASLANSNRILLCLWLVFLPSVHFMAGSPSVQNAFPLMSLAPPHPVLFPESPSTLGVPLYCQPFGESGHSCPSTSPPSSLPTTDLGQFSFHTLLPPWE